MKPIFPKGIDNLKPVIAVTSLVTVVGIALIFNFFFTDAHLSVGYKPDQPIGFSHRLHAGEMKLDCRYCHSNVEKSPHATVPPSQVCMNCHSQVKKNSPKLEELHKRYQEMVTKDLSGIKIKVKNPEFKSPIPWIRIHNIPDYAYFDHSVHINANVGCVSCHDRIDQMPVVKQAEPLTMFWCLDCHRNYEDFVRPADVSVTDMAWKWTDKAAEKAFKEDIRADKKKAAKDRKLNPPEECSACHR